MPNDRPLRCLITLGLLCGGAVSHANPVDFHIEIAVTDAASALAISGATVTIADADSTMILLTDEAGMATWTPHVAGAGIPIPGRQDIVISAYPNPGVREIAIGMPAGKSAFPVTGQFFDLAGRAMPPEAPVATGVYVFAVNLGDQLVASRSLILEGGTRPQDVRVTVGVDDSAIVDSPDKSAAATLTVAAAGYEAVEMAIVLGPAVNRHDVALAAAARYIRFRVTDGTGDNWLPGLRLNLRGPDNRVFNGVSDSDGELWVSVPGSYALSDSFAVYISDTPGFAHNVYAMIAWPRCVDKISSTDGTYAINADTARVALGQVFGLSEGVGFVPLPDVMYEDPEFREMQLDIEQATGNRDYPYAHLILWGYTRYFPDGPIIPGFALQRQRDAIAFWVPQFVRGTGLNLATVSVVEQDTFPDTAEGHFFVWTENSYQGSPGNVRMPGGDGQVTYGFAFSPDDTPTAVMISEIGSLCGLADNRIGSTNLPGFTSSGGVITGLSEKGKHLMVYWGVHGTFDGVGNPALPIPNYVPLTAPAGRVRYSLPTHSATRR